MFIDKKQWEKVEFGTFVENISERIEPNDTTLKVYIGLEHLDSDELKITRFGTPDDVIGVKLKFYKGDIIFGKRRAYQRKAGVTELDGICSAHSMVLRAKTDNIIKDFLPYFLHSNTFMNRAVEISEGSLSPTIKWKTLEKQEFILPPKNTQIEILKGFQSLELAIDQTATQRTRLQALKKRLLQDLVRETPYFGKGLKEKDYTLISFSDIAQCTELHTRTPLSMGIERYLGLENIESERLKIRTWGNIEDGTTFTKLFHKGDVLFGKRRAYLKKVGVADFDGICSGDILVFTERTESIEKGLLKFYTSSDAFMDYAVKTSAGSLSPRTKWKDLADFQFALPNRDIQKQILAIFEKNENALDLLEAQHNRLKLLKQRLLDEMLG